MQLIHFSPLKNGKLVLHLTRLLFCVIVSNTDFFRSFSVNEPYIQLLTDKLLRTNVPAASCFRLLIRYGDIDKQAMAVIKRKTKIIGFDVRDDIFLVFRSD